jgi:hypothetical protein
MYENVYFNIDQKSMEFKGIIMLELGISLIRVLPDRGCVKLPDETQLFNFSLTKLEFW